MKVNDVSERLLKAAMQRILAGTPIRSSGAFTVATLAVEAGLSRRTAGRATAVLRDFREAGERANGPSSDNGESARLRDELVDLRKKLADRSAEARRLRVELGTLACRVALLSEENAQLRAALSNGKVVPLPATASQPAPMTTPRRTARPRAQGHGDLRSAKGNLQPHLRRNPSNASTSTTSCPTPNQGDSRGSA